MPTPTPVDDLVALRDLAERHDRMAARFSFKGNAKYPAPKTGNREYHEAAARQLRSAADRLEAQAAEIARLREALVAERQRWWQPEYPDQPKPKLVVWFDHEPEGGLSGFDSEADRDAFSAGGHGPFLRRVTGNGYRQMFPRQDRALARLGQPGGEK